MSLTDALGWLGSFMILIGYFLISKRKVSGGDVGYEALNLFGASGLAVNAYAQEAWPILILEFVWFGIAASSLRARSIRRKQKNN